MCQRSIEIVRYVQLVSSLSNLAAKQIKMGDFDEATSTCKCALKAMQLIDSQKIYNCMEIVEKMIERTMVKVMQKSNTKAFLIDVDVIALSLNEYTSFANFEQMEYKRFPASPIIVDCNDIQSVCSDDAELICSVIMYNIGVSMYLSATKLHIAGDKSSKLDGSRKVLELSSEIYQISNKSEIQLGMNRELIKLTLSWLSTNLLCAISCECRELQAITETRKNKKELEKRMNQMKLEESRKYGNLLQQKAASAA